MDCLVEVLGIFIVCALILFLMVAGGQAIGYFNWSAYEDIYLDDVLVYSGMGRHVGWSQLGEVGNSYYVKVYKKGFWNKFFGKVEKCYVGKNLIIKSDKILTNKKGGK